LATKRLEHDAMLSKAIEYCRKQLAIMDGSAEAGIKRIGTERFEKMVRDVVRTMERAHGIKTKPTP
jgi:hypothetical protein